MHWNEGFPRTNKWLGRYRYCSEHVHHRWIYFSLWYMIITFVYLFSRTIPEFKMERRKKKWKSQETHVCSYYDNGIKRTIRRNERASHQMTTFMIPGQLDPSQRSTPPALLISSVLRNRSHFGEFSRQGFLRFLHNFTIQYTLHFTSQL